MANPSNLAVLGSLVVRFPHTKKNESQENIGRVDYLLHDNFIAKSRILLLLLVADETFAVTTTSKTCMY